MDNLEEKILKSFKRNMDSKLRHELIYLYNIYNIYKQSSYKDPKRNLIEIEESYKNVLKEIDTKNKELDDSIVQYYVMLSDCINNYDENNSVVKEKTIQLLTKLEILLNLPVTYKSQIEKNIADLVTDLTDSEMNYDKKEGVGFDRRNK